MFQSDFQSRLARSPFLRYGLSATSFAIAFALALLAQSYEFRNVELPLFLLAVAITAWYAGSGPTALSLVLSIGFFDYFFTEPRYTLSINASDLPYFIVFVSFALLVAGFSAVRRRVEGELRQARDQLQAEVMSEPSRRACSTSHMTRSSSAISMMSSPTGIVALRNCTAGRRRRPLENGLTNFCARFFRRRSPRLARCCCRRGDGKANSGT